MYKNIPLVPLISHHLQTTDYHHLTPLIIEKKTVKQNVQYIIKMHHWEALPVLARSTMLSNI